MYEWTVSHIEPDFIEAYCEERQLFREFYDLDEITQLIKNKLE